jgi:nitrite reductase/ring-hydroxylating ferredoxin subunit
MTAFFDPALFEQGGAAFIREGKLDEALRKLIPGASISKGCYSYPSRSELRDLVWNHMDQNHRPFIHRTYGEASRIFIDGRASFSLTRFGGWPIVIPVFDGYYKENGFYQVMVLFGLIAVVNVIECQSAGNGTKMDISWAIASHRWLRFLHPLLHRRFVRLNEVQNREDNPIRDRRIALRAAGYRFKTDNPDFINANVIENNAIFPPVAAPDGIALAALPDQRAVRVPFAERAFILRRDRDAVEVWPGVCLHEGAELDVRHLGDAVVKCPWHGLEFAARRLEEGGRAVELCGARLDLAGGKILVNPLPSVVRA